MIGDPNLRTGRRFLARKFHRARPLAQSWGSIEHDDERELMLAIVETYRTEIETTENIRDENPRLFEGDLKTVYFEKADPTDAH